MKIQMKYKIPAKLSRIGSLKSDQHGYSLLEGVIGLALILIVAANFMSLFGKGLRTTGTSKYSTTALYIARNHLESIKNTDPEYVPVNFPDGIPTDIDEESGLPEGSSCVVTYPSGTSSNPLLITVTVSWPENGGSQSIQLATEVVSDEEDE